jgi:predicted phage terminase large subunit-like protein
MTDFNAPLQSDLSVFEKIAREQAELDGDAAEIYAGISVDDAVAELLRRQRSQISLAEYARSIDIPGAPASADPENEQFRSVETSLQDHHLLFLNKAQACIEKPSGRLMVFCPPGSAKSTYLSIVTPAWCLAKWPGYRVILASYASDIAEKHSRRCRAVCRQEEHVSIWPDQPELRIDQRSVGSWALSNGSEFMAAGLLAGITGNRADLVIIDDPVKGREEADSPTVQKKTADEYRDSVMSRLKPNASVIIIQTRWNENDLAGGLLPEDYDGRSGPVLCRDGQVWEVVNLPAECERPDDPLGRKAGEFLWPDWFPEDHWLQRKNDPQGQRTWASLYQQRPTAGDGIEFKREWFKWYDPDAERDSERGLPKDLTIYAASDYATKQDKGDFTEHGIWGIDAKGDLWVLDWWFGQKTTDITIAQKIQMIRKFRILGTPIMKWWHEGGPIGNAIMPAVGKAMREAKQYCVMQDLTSIQNKAVKLASFQARAASGTVHWPTGRPWATRAVDQLCGFPAARYDDAADVCGLIGRGIDEMSNPHIPSKKTKPSLVPFSVAWLTYQERNESNKPRYF